MDPNGTLAARKPSQDCARLLKQKTPACAIISGWGASAQLESTYREQKDHAGTFSLFPVVSSRFSCQVAMRPKAETKPAVGDRVVWLC